VCADGGGVMNSRAAMTGKAAPKNAYVLVGGGGVGAVEVGMLKALAATGMRPDLIVSTSACAINGTYAAARLDPVDICEQGRLSTTTQRRNIFAFSVPTMTRHNKV
jgi:NTE family protein